MLPLLPDTHEMLRRAMPFFDFEKTTKPTAQEIADTLIEAMHHYSAIGIAANQIGIEERVCAIHLQNGESIALFNPIVTWLSNESWALNEGCLTFGALTLKIDRPKECQVAYDDADGKRRVLDLSGIDARCILHEIDHLEGKLFTENVSKLKLDMAKKKARKKA